MAYFQYSKKAIDEDRLRSILAIVEAKSRNEYATDLWERVKERDAFIDEYISYLDKLFMEKRKNGPRSSVLKMSKKGRCEL